MPYTYRVVVPRITVDSISEINKKMPGFSGMVTVPLIQCKEDAIKVATAQTHKRLSTSEYVSKTETIEETPTGWEIIFRISGD